MLVIKSRSHDALLMCLSYTTTINLASALLSEKNQISQTDHLMNH